MVTNLITYTQLQEIAAPTVIGPIVKGFVDNLTKYADKYGINTYLRLCHFIAQCAEESDRFSTLKEYASGAEYEDRKDLGNLDPGDGIRYKGRGYIQLTGKSNYAHYGTILGVDLLNHPELAEEPEVGLLVSLEYWKQNNINALADKDNLTAVTHAVNGGLTGYSVRLTFLNKAKATLKDVVFNTVIIPPTTTTLTPKTITDPQKQTAISITAGATVIAGGIAAAVNNGVTYMSILSWLIPIIIIVGGGWYLWNKYSNKSPVTPTKPALPVILIPPVKAANTSNVKVTVVPTVAVSLPLVTTPKA